LTFKINNNSLHHLFLLNFNYFTRSNIVPIETVSKMLGHTKITTTQIYAQVLENKVSNDMNDLKGKLSNAKKSQTGT
jgi:integrase/recombinase XerD